MWWHTYGADISTDAELWTSSEEAARIYGLHLSSARDTIAHGGNSGYQAVRLAIEFGCSPIVLLGYDMKFQGSRRHWHADHDESQGVGNPLPERLSAWCQRLEALIARAGANVVNATRDTALRLPRASLAEALCARG